MGTCISSSSIHPNTISISATMEHSERSDDRYTIYNNKEATTISPDTSDCPQYSSGITQEGTRNCNEDVSDNILNTEFDWTSEEESVTEHSKEKSNIENDVIEEEIIAKVHSDYDDDYDDLSEYDEGDIFWIPATLASHMGLRASHISPQDKKARDRIYANDEDLFMSVEASRRSSYLVVGSARTNKTKSEITVQNSFINSHAIDLISLGRN